MLVKDITLYQCLASLPWLCWGLVLAGFVGWVVQWVANGRRKP